MSKFVQGEKAPKQTAINELLIMISNYYDGRYEVKTNSDDGGAVLEVFSASLDEQAPDFPFFDIWPKWMGWRVVIAKVPPGYIDAITLSPESDY